MAVARLTWPPPATTFLHLSSKMQKQAFAMNVSGFHFDVAVTDMAAYDFVGGELEARSTLLFLIDRRHRVWLMFSLKPP